MRTYANTFSVFQYYIGHTFHSNEISWDGIKWIHRYTRCIQRSILYPIVHCNCINENTKTEFYRDNSSLQNIKPGRETNCRSRTWLIAYCNIATTCNVHLNLFLTQTQVIHHKLTCAWRKLLTLHHISLRSTPLVNIKENAKINIC